MSNIKVNYLNAVISNCMQDDYYVYVYLRNKDSKTAPKGTPYYVGKGNGNHAYVKHNCPVPNDESNILFIAKNLTEKEAHLCESKLISFYGRKDLQTGILHNRTNGGEGLSNPSQSTRKKLADAKRNESDSTRQRRSLAAKNRPKRKTSNETKQKISLANTGKKRSDEARKKMSVVAIGRPSSKKGKKDSLETRIKKSIAAKNRRKSQT